MLSLIWDHPLEVGTIYPYFKDGEIDSEILYDLHKSKLTCFWCPGCWPFPHTMQQHRRVWTVSKMFVLFSFCLCKGFQLITSGRKEFVIVNKCLFLLTVLVLLPHPGQQVFCRVSISFWMTVNVFLYSLLFLYRIVRWKHRVDTCPLLPWRYL